MTLDALVFFGLYSYVRQLELSLDRALSEGSTKNLSTYFNSSKYKPDTVIEYFSKAASCNEGFLFINHKSCFSILKRKINLSLNEMLELIEMIKKYSTAINNKTFDLEHLVKIRMRLNNMHESILGSKISKTQKKRLNKVEHYNQSNYLNLLNIDELLGSEWLDW